MSLSGNSDSRRTSPPKGSGPGVHHGRGFKNITDVTRYEETFGAREVGLTHPDHDGFIRITDRGDVEIFSKPGLGIIMHSSNNSISFVADSVRFLTKDQDGLRWNNVAFNPKATTYSEPSLLPYDPEDASATSMYEGFEDYQLRGDY